MAHWINEFVEFSSFLECSPKALYWVGVWTIAGALRRKVWIDQIAFQWTPNFYLLIVGPPGAKKTTSIGMGMRFLSRVEGLDFGPESVTWQQMITHLAKAKETYNVDDAPFEASCCTISLNEFGTFFDPANRELVDNLTNIWDSKLGTLKKETKTMGDDEVINPWLNIAAGTTPGWMADNFSSKLMRSGFASRPVFLWEPIAPEEKDVPYPSRRVVCSNPALLEADLLARLQQIAQLSGEFRLTEEAYQWGERWYKAYRAAQRSMGSEQEAAFYERKQTHLHKLAMVICAATDSFPTITVEHLQEADARLNDLQDDVKTIFGFVGQTRLSAVASELLEVIKRKKQIRKSLLYHQYFFRTMIEDEFESALKSVVACGLIRLTGPLDDLLIVLKE